MGLKVTRIAFRLESPLHVGWRKVGNLQQTRPYVTGRVIWGALVARLTREISASPDKTHYEQMRDKVNEELAFTYFFPAIALKNDSGLETLKHWRRIDNYGVCLDPLADENSSLFPYVFLDTYASTALDYSRLGAEQGSLHEVEHIRPRTRALGGSPLEGIAADEGADEIGAQVYLVGYIFEKEGSTLLGQSIEPVANKLQLGGERTYGWGRVTVADVSELGQDGEILIFGYKLDDRTKWPPEIQIPKDSPIAAHALAAEFKDGSTHHPVSGVAGTVEPLVWRETRFAESFGREITPARVCWTPGARVISESVTIRIGLYGIWEKPA
jgi:hypothetical protein